MATSKKPTSSAAERDAQLTCVSPAAWLAWLAKHHASSTGVWLRIAKKDGGHRSVSYAEAIEGALMWGWIDGQKDKLDDTHWLQRFSPRAARSPWSKINRDKATALLAAGKLEAPGVAEVERAQRDGRWERAYDSPSASTVPADLAAALAANGQAAKRFATLDSANRYAILYRVQAPKLAETRARKIAEYVAMLARGETLHPQKPPKKPTAKTKTKRG